MTNDSKFERVNTQDFSTLFDNLRKLLPELPIKDTLRNNKLRNEILKRLTAQYLTDEERAEFYGLPQGCRIREGAKILSQENLKIGEYCWIGENAILDASGGLEIGSHSSIGLSVFIWSHTSHLTNLTKSNESNSNLIERKSTKIGSGCFIAGPSVVLSGVTVGDKVLVRPFSVIDKDVPSRSIVDRNGVQENVLSEKLIERLAKKQMHKSLDFTE